MKTRIFILILAAFVGSVWPQLCRALPPGTLLYRTGTDGKMFGYSGDPLLETKRGIMTGLNAGHVAVYIGQIEGEDYVVEALAGGIVKTPARNFVNEAAGEKFLGAKIPRAATPLQQARVVALAKSLAAKGLAYDLDFKRQKGPDSGQWTCVGLTEKIYESADIPNPNNLGALEYDTAYYALDITPDGFDDYSAPDADGDRFARDREFSQIARRDRMLVPAPEIIGFDAGLEYGDQRYIFLPYTQFLQPSLAPVETDIAVSSSFDDAEFRRRINTKALALRWSLINNPLSALRVVADKTKVALASLWQKVFGSGDRTELVWDDEESTETASDSDDADYRAALPAAVVHKNTGEQSIDAPVKSDDAVKPSSDWAPDVVIAKSQTTVQVNTKKEDNKAADDSVPATIYNLPAAPAAAPPAVKAPAPSATVNANHNPATPAAAAGADDAPKLARINKIYATGANDWIELFNPTDYDFDLAEAGYRLEKAKTAEDPSLVMRLGNSADGAYPRGTVIKARGRYLIVRAAASDYFRDRADAIATRDDFNWNGSGYTLYLGLDAISASTDPDIVEAVGFGPDATYYQGSAPAPAIMDNYVLTRIAANKNNQNDFTLVASDDPGIIWESDGGGDDEEADDTASSTPVAPLILINKIYATENNDWLELFNFGDTDFDLAAGAYRLEKTKTAESPSLVLRFGNLEDGAYPGGTVIKAQDSYIVVRDDANDYYRNQADAIVTRDEFGWTGKDYTLYLGRDAISSSTDPDILDAVGFGAGATYFAGAGPAPEIPDAYILSRLSRSGDNQADFGLIASDDPGLASSTPSAADTGRFVAPTPTVSEGLTNLFHFDQCHGAGSWAVGRWDCAREIGYRTEKFSTPLASAVDLNRFSLSFYYKKYSEWPRLSLAFSNAGGDKVRFILDPSLVTIEGLPNSQWRYYTSIPFDETWHQASLVVDQAADYWAVYIDGEEKVRESFFAQLPLLTDLEVSSDNDAALIDEIATWNRPLAGGELSANYLLAAPYSPLAARLPQGEAQLKHLWSFEEDAGLSAQDSVGQLSLAVSENSWVGRRHGNYALHVNESQNFTVPINFTVTPSTRDLSLAFWWRNSAYPNLGRITVSLLGGPGQARKRLVLGHDYLRSTFWFNDNYGFFAEGINQAVPNDAAWHHLAVVYDSYRYQLSFYVDGVEKSRRPFIWMPDGENISQLSVGSDNFGADIDELSFWAGALSPDQVKEVYDASQ